MKQPLSLINSEEGASLFERAVVGSLKQEQRLPYLRKLYGEDNVEPTDSIAEDMDDSVFNDNFLINNEAGNFLFNPSGFERGDIAEYSKLATQMVGGSLSQLASVAVNPTNVANPNAQLLAFGIGSQLAGKGFDSIVDLQEQVDPFITDYINRGGTLEQLNDASKDALLEIAGGKFVDSIPFKEGLKNFFSSFFSGRLIGAETREQGRAIIKEASEIGVDTPSLNVTLKNPYLEGILRSLPFSSQTIQKKAIETQEQLGQSILDLVGDVKLVGGQEIGNFIKEGLLRRRQVLKNRQEKLYDKAFALIPDNTKISMKPLEALRDALQREIASAPESLSPIITPALKRVQSLIDDANRLKPEATKQINFLQKQIDELAKKKEGIVLQGRAKTQRDLGVDTKINEKLATIERIQSAPNNKIGLDIETARKIRTQTREASTTKISTVGDQIPQNRYISQLYNAITGSLKETTEEVGGVASKAFGKADRFTRVVATKVAPLLEKVGKYSEEEGLKVYALLKRGTKEGDGEVKKIMALLDPEEQDIVRRSVLQRMSTRQIKEAGEIASEEFSPQVFITEWGKMSPQAKNALFGGKEKQFRNDIEKIVGFSKSFVDSGKELNTSKTSSLTGTLATLIAPIVYSGGLNSELIETVALTGVGQFAFAKVITNPKIVRALVSASEENTSVPVFIGSLIGLAADGSEQDFDAVQAYLTAVASSMVPTAEASEREKIDIFDIGEDDVPRVETYDKPETPDELVNLLKSLSPTARQKILNATSN